VTDRQTDNAALYYSWPLQCGGLANNSNVQAAQLTNNLAETYHTTFRISNIQPQTLTTCYIF